MPGNPQARGVFEAIEQARVEAIGSRRMSGVAKNLTAMLDDHFHRGKYDEITDRADAQLADALALLLRERVTGFTPPTAARKMVDRWCPIPRAPDRARAADARAQDGRTLESDPGRQNRRAARPAGSAGRGPGEI